MKIGLSLRPFDFRLAILVLGLAGPAFSAPAPLLHGSEVILQPVFSPDASRLAFASTLPDLVTNDANGRADVFVRYLDSGRTLLLSTNRSGVGANGNSFQPRASADGRRVVFQSQATDLTSTIDLNGRDDLFLLDLDAGTTTIINTNRLRQPATNGAAAPFISVDGAFVVFQSASADLVPAPASGYSTDLYQRRTDNGRIDMLRAITNGPGKDWGISVYTPVIVKYRDAKTDTRIQLEDLLR